jgi:CubicO group peptidase (beta-lactamase class C family)
LCCDDLGASVGKRRDTLKNIEEILGQGLLEGAFPGGVLLVAKRGEIVLHQEAGLCSMRPKQEPMTKETIFDLASLTKPLATTLAVMKLVDQEKIHLDQPLSEIIRRGSLKEKGSLTPRLLLNHSAGFVAWKPLYSDLVKEEVGDRRRILRRRILKEPLVYSPGEECLYSDWGFMILEWIIEEVSGMPMHRFLDDHFYGPMSLKRTFIYTGELPTGLDKAMFAATKDCPLRNRIIRGEVEDDVAYALSGYSGHAGLFSTAEELYALVALLRDHYYGKRDDFLSPELVREFFRRQDIVEGCTWALGWDTPSPENSSSGRHFSPRSVGHLGFTGTSVWMDLEKDVIVVFLTNRTLTADDNEKIKAFRPQLHDLIMEELGLSREGTGVR